MSTIESHKELRELMRQLERKTGTLNNLQMACCNITLAQCHALVEVGRAGHISLVELSDALGLDTSTISRTVNHLVSSGAVNRETDPANRRYVIISLTDDGQKIFDGIEAGMGLYYKQILQKIPQDKQAQVLDAVQTLLNALEEVKI